MFSSRTGTDSPLLGVMTTRSRGAIIRTTPPASCFTNAQSGWEATTANLRTGLSGCPADSSCLYRIGKLYSKRETTAKISVLSTKIFFYLVLMKPRKGGPGSTILENNSCWLDLWV